MTELPNWRRDQYRRTQQKALLFYVAFGQFESELTLDPARFRSAGLPQGCELSLLTREENSDYITGICSGYLWDELRCEQPELAHGAEMAPACIAIKGELDDPPNLNYFRDTIGVISCLLAQGDSVLYDPLQLRWWSREEWNRESFEPAGPRFNQHVVILTSAEPAPGMTWVHTRGLRKFARPEISVHHVGREHLKAVIDLCERFIDFQARGGIIEEGQEIRVKVLPSGGIVHHGGHVDDPDFNNVHFEIVWPENVLAR